MPPENKNTDLRPPRDRIAVFLAAARTACKDQVAFYKDQSNKIQTSELGNPDKMREMESTLEDMNRYQYGVEQLEMLSRYLS